MNLSKVEPDSPALTNGIKHFMKGRYEQAYQLLLPFAEGGTPRAQTLLAKMYFAGNGVEKSFDQYVYWLTRAALAGDRTAKAKLKRLDRSENASHFQPR